MLSHTTQGGVVELVLDQAPCNEIGTAHARGPGALFGRPRSRRAHAHPPLSRAGASRRRRPARAAPGPRRPAPPPSTSPRSREFLDRIHRRDGRLDMLPLTTIGVIHGVCFGGGFELALTCDVLIAEKSRPLLLPRAAPRHHPRLRRHPPPAPRRRQRPHPRPPPQRPQRRRQEGAHQSASSARWSSAARASPPPARSPPSPASSTTGRSPRRQGLHQAAPAEELAREKELFVELAQRPACSPRSSVRREHRPPPLPALRDPPWPRE
jgi:hypothetical protein